ncbi:PREDICTED: uncharacterized protein LOC106812518 [Priapulus caudatus]|uniref:Uncharacterized protein LOC106812518 n=1 Tax=Priapulus caudatus TaxID=37621 RepID=A0ABM1EI78_PRICU|nr:PREDICTED: uncharacterized protein LOC106812518 [Priapulus caudatus]
MSAKVQLRRSVALPAAEPELVKQGWMEVHKNKVMGQWKRRYCILTSDAFVYFKVVINWLSADDRRTKPCSEVRLTHVDMVTQHVRKTNVITLKLDRKKLTLKADTGHEQWFSAISNAVAASRQHQQVQKEFSRVSRQLESRGETVLNIRKSMMVGNIDVVHEEAAEPESNALDLGYLRDSVDLDDERVGFGSLQPKQPGYASATPAEVHIAGNTPKVQKARLMGRSSSDAVTKLRKSPDVRRHNTNPEDVRRPDPELVRSTPCVNLASIDSEEGQLDTSSRECDDGYMYEHVPSTEL